MSAIILFIVVGSVVFIGAYYLIVRLYYWGPKTNNGKAVKHKPKPGP